MQILGAVGNGCVKAQKGIVYGVSMGMALGHLQACLQRAAVQGRGDLADTAAQGGGGAADVGGGHLVTLIGSARADDGIEAEGLAGFDHIAVQRFTSKLQVFRSGGVGRSGVNSGVLREHTLKQMAYQGFLGNIRHDEIQGNGDGFTVSSAFQQGGDCLDLETIAVNFRNDRKGFVVQFRILGRNAELLKHLFQIHLFRRGQGGSFIGNFHVVQAVCVQNVVVQCLGFQNEIRCTQSDHQILVDDRFKIRLKGAVLFLVPILRLKGVFRSYAFDPHTGLGHFDAVAIAEGFHRTVDVTQIQIQIGQQGNGVRLFLGLLAGLGVLGIGAVPAVVIGLFYHSLHIQTGAGLLRGELQLIAGQTHHQILGAEAAGQGDPQSVGGLLLSHAAKIDSGHENVGQDLAVIFRGGKKLIF